MRIAIVIPWFGREIKGGAEQQAWQIAARLAQRKHEVEVLTTCCRSHQDDWETNHLPAGHVVEPEGFGVRRFPVEERDRQGFDRACGNLLSMPVEALVPGSSPVPAEEAEVFVDELIKSAALLDFLRAKKSDYDWFVLMPYLYGPVLRGTEIVAERAALQPCLHDEAYAYLPQVADAFRRAKKILFNSEGERELALRLYGPTVWEKSAVVGEGVEPEPIAAASEPVDPGYGRYVLYLGRKDAGKNVDLLVRAFSRFRAVRPNSDLRLVLAGHGAVDLDGAAPAAVDVGLVSEEHKQALLLNCLALAQPSRNESFSRVMMEAWSVGKPVAVHSECLATAVAVQECGGGWAAASEGQWAALFAQLDRLSQRELALLGERGREYAELTSDWDKVMDRYEKILGPPKSTLKSTLSGPPIVKTASRAVTINQFLPNLEYGDAISNNAIWIRDTLREFGFSSDIYVRYIDPRVEHECRVFSPDALHASSAIIYHHSVGTEITPHVLQYAGPKCLIYHNITPPEFFEMYAPDYAKVLRAGREELRSLASQFRISYGASAYNAHELGDMGFAEPAVLPICVSPEKWDVAPDPELMQELGDGRTNLLFVGRVAPNKRQDELVEAFSHYLALDPTARLILVGKAQENDPYDEHLHALIRTLRLEDSVVMPGSIPQEQLAAYYRSAHLFWSASEHEGFCVPLIEAMWFDVPVLAFASSAIPETLGEAAFMYTEKQNLRDVAALAHIVATDGVLRRNIVRAQRNRRAAFLPREVAPQLALLADKLGTLATSQA